MSGFEHYQKELADIDHEIAHWAAICRVDPSDAAQLEACRRTSLTQHGIDHSCGTLRGLLLLRLRLENEMIELGMNPPAFRLPVPKQ